MAFDLTDLSLFVAVCDAGSITRGAAQVGLSVPSASVRIRRMEDVAGGPLLERRHRGVEPTPAGRTVLHHARLVGEQVRRLTLELADLRQGVGGHVRILSNTAALSEVLPRRIGAYLRDRPWVRIDFEERLSGEIVDDIRNARADIGIIASGPDTAGLREIPFGSDELVVVMPPDDPLAALPAVPFPSLFERALIGLTGGSPLYGFLAAKAAVSGGELYFRLRLRGFGDICQVVAEGIGVSVVIRSAAERYTGAAPLTIRPLDAAWAKRTLLMVVNPRIHPSPAAVDFVEAMRQPDDPALAHNSG